MDRKATAVWQGDLRHGKGMLTTESKVLSDTPYSFSTRFEGVPGTNPEELLGADRAKFDAAAASAKANCPLSKVLRAEISMTAKLEA